MVQDRECSLFQNTAEIEAVPVSYTHLFYFSLYLIGQKIPFAFFEDAAGMLSRARELYDALAVKFPIHAEIAQKHGLFDGTNPYIREVICFKRAQAGQGAERETTDFSVEEALSGLPDSARRKLIRFFLRRKIRTRAQAILLTQHFANLGMMSERQQERMYEMCIRDRHDARLSERGGTLCPLVWRSNG